MTPRLPNRARVKTHSTACHSTVKRNLLKQNKSSAHLEASVEGRQPGRCSTLCLPAALFVWEVLLVVHV